MIQKKEAQTDSVSPEKTKIDKPVRTRTTKIVEHVMEAVAIEEPKIEETSTENVEVSTINPDEDSKTLNKKSGKDKAKNKVKMKDKDKKKAKKADAKEKAKQKAKSKAKKAKKAKKEKAKKAKIKAKAKEKKAKAKSKKAKKDTIP
ncbi:hypothetical protein ACFX5D_16145 [Flavobacterium sp. LB3P45]|uniref:Uncharacterized protein n=1 Tax=Flavobacterium fructosi TaxID=3230416 RepID=A0ABW6HRM2_9FLAO